VYILLIAGGTLLSGVAKKLSTRYILLISCGNWYFCATITQRI